MLPSRQNPINRKQHQFIETWKNSDSMCCHVIFHVKELFVVVEWLTLCRRDHIRIGKNKDA